GFSTSRLARRAGPAGRGSRPAAGRHEHCGRRQAGLALGLGVERRSKDQREDADDDEQPDQEDDADRSAEKFHHVGPLRVRRRRGHARTAPAAEGARDKQDRRSRRDDASALRRRQSSTCDSRPSASFGSNHVDFGGISRSASATSISSSMLVGWSANATAARPESTRRSSSARPRTPPTNAIRASVRGSAMPSSGAMTRACSRLTSSRPTGSAGSAPDLSASAYHVPSRYMPNVRRAAGLTGRSAARTWNSAPSRSRNSAVVM